MTRFGTFIVEVLPFRTPCISVQNTLHLHFPTNQTFHQFHDLDTDFDLHRITSGFHGSCNGCGMPAGNAYPSGHLVPSPILGLAIAPIVETKFLELAMSLLDFSPRIPLDTFSILLKRKKEEILVSAITKTLTPTENSKKE